MMARLRAAILPDTECDERATAGRPFEGFAGRSHTSIDGTTFSLMRPGAASARGIARDPDRVPLARLATDVGRFARGGWWYHRP